MSLRRLPPFWMLLEEEEQRAQENKVDFLQGPSYIALTDLCRESLI